MKAAITTLEIALQNLETNEPINRSEGNVEQADANLKNAAEIKEAIYFLKYGKEQFNQQAQSSPWR